MNKEKDLFLDVMKKSTSGGHLEKIVKSLSQNKIDWQLLRGFFVFHEFSPFAYLVFKDLASLLPDDLMRSLKYDYYSALFSCEYIWNEFLRISMAFEQAGIDILPMKGVGFLADIYLERPVRPMIDMDLLVRAECLSAAEELLNGLGYRKELHGLKESYWRECQYHITFYKREEKQVPFVELHWDIDYKRKKCGILPDLWGRIREARIDSRNIKLFSPENSLLSLALHNRRFGKVLSLKNVFDAALLLNKYTIDWDYIVSKAKDNNICASLFFSLYQIKYFFDGDIPESVWKELGVSGHKQRAIQSFIEENTFLRANNSLKNKNLYLKSHFLLYDNLWEPVDYILNIPQEQFAKFYGMGSYEKRTEFLYRNRLFYIPFKMISRIINPK
ncbi:MAG: nucleotidyltransferase family protein [Candidatus Omnitrophica bacterium]|nr:nucleotidyltransferase family protein [Candidatus Omnitrophota bacterium]